MLMLPINQMTEFLDASWLTDVDATTRMTVWKFLEEQTLLPKMALFEQGQPNHKLWFVAAGAVNIERSRGGARPEIIAELDGQAIYGTTTFFRNSLPTMTIRARTAVQGWTLDRESYNRLRLEHPEAAEALALTVVRVLSERFDQLDRRLSSLMADHDENHPRATEWANFRSRLFDEPAA